MPQQTDETSCLTCGYPLQPGQLECPNCGAVWTETILKDLPGSPAGLTAAGKQPSAAGKLPAWLAVQEMVGRGRKLERDGDGAQALQLYYQALVLAAEGRPENPTLGAVIHNLVTLIEKSERALMGGADETVEEEPAGLASVSQRLPEAVGEETLTESEPVGSNHLQLTPENIEAIDLIESWESHAGEAYQAAFSPTGDCLATCCGNDVQLRTYPGGEHVNSLKGHLNQVYGVAFSPNGKQVATGSADWDVRLWNLDGGILKPVPLEQKLEGHSDAILSLAFSPDGNLVASGGLDHRVLIWQMPNGTLLGQLKGHEDGIESVGFSKDGKWLASSDDGGKIILWDTKQAAAGRNAALRSWMGHEKACGSVAFSPRGVVLASCGDDAAVKLWHLPDGVLIKSLEAHKAPIENLAFAPDGQLLASCDDDGIVYLWNAVDGSLLTELEHVNGVNSVTFSPDGRALVTVTEEGTICLWKVNE